MPARERLDAMRRGRIPPTGIRRTRQNAGCNATGEHAILQPQERRMAMEPFVLLVLGLCLLGLWAVR
jgi:hypothetical protein